MRWFALLSLALVLAVAGRPGPPVAAADLVVQPAVGRALPAGPLPLRQGGGTSLLAGLGDGGFVLLFRHAATDRSQKDVDYQNLANCETQRNLSEGGRAQARAVGAAIERLGIPIGAVLASPYCRALETARLAFGRADSSDDLVSELSDDTPEGRGRLTAGLLALLATVPAPGTNTVLVTHTLNIESALGFEVDEGEAVVARPDGAGGFAVTARVAADAWDRLDAAP